MIIWYNKLTIMETNSLKISFKFVLIADIYFISSIIVTLNKKSIVKFIFFLYLFFNCQKLLRDILPEVTIIFSNLENKND